ncbi:ANR family transcriptional regulator [Martelella alba]|uniref:ANR family transcriptional regulator n=1 Tax=Martelella alba TaxID=2590451 RepID=A0ABY2SKS1_9HYPH|nr:ANR family transcriptional regulator [Martelella alba]TKI06227.1 ANR family transcriptional regulator [Martelella alba]
MSYAELAAKAAALERANKFSEAQDIWQQAYKLAAGENLAWTLCRAEYCQMAITREWSR